MPPKITLERNFQKKVIRELKTLKNTYFHKHEAGGIGGIPDIVGCCNRHFFALELKRAEKTRPTALQAYTLEKIQRAKGIALVVHPGNWPNVFDYLKNLSEEKKSVQDHVPRAKIGKLPPSHLKSRKLRSIPESEGSLQSIAPDEDPGTPLC